MSNLRQIGLALQMYAQENKGQFPPDFAALLRTQDMLPEPFVCPASADELAAGPDLDGLIADFRKPGHCSYTYTAAGLTWGTLPARYVIAYDASANHTDGVSNVLYADGSAEPLKKTEMDHVLSELAKGHNPSQ